MLHPSISDGVIASKNVQNFMREVGLTLALEHGLSVIPIAPGTKYPGQFYRGAWHGYQDWERHAQRMTTENEVEIWSGWPGCGVGIAAGRLVGGFDADVRDEGVADKVSRKLRELLGRSPIRRIGERPKFLDVYRIDQPFRSIKRHPLEFLSLGNQFVSHAVHPTTGKPYLYPEEQLHEVGLEDLPLVTEEMVKKALEACFELIPEEMRISRLPKDRGGELYHAAAGDPTGTPEAVASALAYMGNPDLPHGDWVKIAMAIKVAIGDAGWEIFDDWSSKSAKYNAKETARVWKAIKREEVHSVSARTIFGMSRDLGWIPEDHLILSGEVARRMRENPHPAQALIERERMKALNGHALLDDVEETDQEEIESAEQVEPDAPRVNAELAEAVVAGAGGILHELTDWMCATSRFPQPLLSLGASLTLVGALAGHKYRMLDGPDTRTNLLLMGVAGSGSGKEHPRGCIKKLVNAAGVKEYLFGRAFASQQGITGKMANQFSGVFLVDEMGHVLRAVMSERSPAYLRGIANTIMELATSATGMYIEDARLGDREAGRVPYDIPDPCLNMFATTTPHTLWGALTSGSALDGFLARWVLFETPLNYPDPQFDCEPLERRLPDLAAMIQQIVVGPGLEVNEISLASGKSKMMPIMEESDLGQEKIRRVEVPDVYIVPMTEMAKEVDRAITRKEVQLKRENEGVSLATAILARTAEHVRRLALIRAISRDAYDPQVDGEDMLWAEQAVRLSHSLMIPAVEAKVSDNEAEGFSKKVLEVIAKHGDWIDTHTLIQKTRFVDRPKRKGILDDLVEAGLLQVQVKKTKTKPKTMYRAVKTKG
jgi:hypothetical protein